MVEELQGRFDELGGAQKLDSSIGDSLDAFGYHGFPFAEVVEPVAEIALRLLGPFDFDFPRRIQQAYDCSKAVWKTLHEARVAVRRNTEKLLPFDFSVDPPIVLDEEDIGA